MASESTSASPARQVFVTTQWSVVLTAADTDTTRSRAALEDLCRAYWHPLYHYVRRRGYGPQDAQDLTQSFFARFLERQAVARADPDRGRFRSFLLKSLKHFLADEWDKARALKRGGGQPVLSLDYETEERRLQPEPAELLTPDKAYERRWAIALLDQVYHQLEAEARRQGKVDQFAVLQTALIAPRGSVAYAELAKRADMTEGAVKVAVHRMRKRYRELLKSTIAETVSGPGEVEDELRHLLGVLAG